MANKDVKFLNESDIVFTGGFSQPIGVGALITVVITAVGTGTVTVHGSAQELPPDASLASTITNSHVPVVLADYTTPNTYTPGTVTVAGGTAIVECNTNLLNWITIQRSAGTVEVLVSMTNNE